MSRIIIFCANQISVCIANELLKKLDCSSNLSLIYQSGRCDLDAFPGLKKFAKPYNRLTFFSLYLKATFFRPDEVILPHLRWRAAKLISMLSREVSLIDDGLDTFRNEPRNIDTKHLAYLKKFYTFDYKVMANWVKKMDVVPVCPVRNLSSSSKKIIQLDKYDLVIVESPGVYSYIKQHQKKHDNCLFVQHSNYRKRRKIDYACDILLGGNFALEASLEKFKGTVIVGESMVAVYLMSLPNSSFKLELCITEGNLENLCMLKSMADCLPNVNAHIVN